MTITLSARLSWLRRDIEAAIEGSRRLPAVLARLRRVREEIAAAQKEADAPTAESSRQVAPDGDVRDLDRVV